MKIGLLGCGAMGSLYGGYLSKAHEVYVCDVWKEHIEAIKANGIRLDEPEGETAVFTPKFATTDPSEIGPVDIMIVFVKYMMLEDALRNAKSMIGENTIVLSLQNGIGNYDEIAKVVPEEQICCGTTAHGCTFLEPGHVRHTGRGVTNVGTLKGPFSNAQKVAEALQAAGFEAVAHENVMQLICTSCLPTSPSMPSPLCWTRPTPRLRRIPMSTPWRRTWSARLSLSLTPPAAILMWRRS